MSDVLHTVFVTHNRLELTKRTIASYMETVTLPYSAIVIDNDSTDGTADWLRDNVESLRAEHPFDFFVLGFNKYPGYAANMGWGYAPDWATLLHRSDNDMEYLPGWCEEVVRCFEDPHVGQVGLRTVEEEGDVGNVGGNCVIRADVWDKGARYDERPWMEVPFEDGHMSMAVRRLRYRIERVSVPCATHIGIATSTDSYYQQTFADRGITFAQYGIE